MPTRMPQLQRQVIPTERTEIYFDNVTLKELRDTIDTYIKEYGAEAYVKETCEPHDNYSFSVFVNIPESEKDYKARCAQAKKRHAALRVQERSRDEKELARLQEKLGIKKT